MPVLVPEFHVALNPPWNTPDLLEAQRHLADETCHNAALAAFSRAVWTRL